MEQRNKRLTAVMGTFFLALILFVAGCASGPLSTREKGVLAGGGLGAATGAIIGSAVGAPGAGAAIGGGIGALGGGVIGDQLQGQENTQAYQQRQLDQQQRQIRRQQRQLEELRRRQE